MFLLTFYLLQASRFNFCLLVINSTIKFLFEPFVTFLNLIILKFILFAFPDFSIFIFKLFFSALLKSFC